jgi:citrate lyase subunit beta/citryl-CoA lyase
MEKARDLPADALIFDLEDAVAPEAKAAARDNVVAASHKGTYGKRELVIRVNGASTPWGNDDLKAVAHSAAAAVLLPKVEHAETVHNAIHVLEGAGAPADLGIWIMAETPRGVLNLDPILAGQPRLQAVVMGTSDLARDLRVSPLGERLGLIHALSHCVLAARARSVDIIDGVHLALDDTEGFRRACKQGRELGFDGKSLIHPRQIEIANACFGVTDEEVELAREIVTAWQIARTEKRGVTVVRGQLVEQLHVDDAHRVIALHEATRT